ncbi:MAG: GNAT family N-acetyltransferase [Candidatus Undinarchaeales archaeon]|nr:GNAT family N-acetyltransferase [Candidatus Undinarchaeales archaeon]MDP7492741.1 GNAT family N-acetyltransferase [Candidatus Undinarchaeales archaeon]
MEDLEIRLTCGREEFETVLAIRREVFVEGQSVPLDRELDGLDDGAEHILVLLGSEPIGCARVRTTGRTARLERIAVLKGWRGKGFGQRLVVFLVDHCQKHGMEKVVLHSQCAVRGFYEELGFTAHGPIFMDAGIEHVRMVLGVPSAGNDPD